MLEFDEEGNLLEHWGGPTATATSGRIRITESRSITKAMSGLAATVVAPPRRAREARGTAPGRQPTATNRRRRRGAVYYHDSMILKFTQDGKFLMQIGKPGAEQRQQRHREPGAARQDLRRSEDQRTVRGRWLRQSSA